MPASLKRSMELQRRIAEALRCKTCGGKTTVMNLAARGFWPEPISDTTHCVCPGGPVAIKKLGGLKPLALLEQ